MNAALQTHVQVPVVHSVAPSQASILQRKCACGGATGAGECSDCDKKKLALERSARISEQGKLTFGRIPPIVHEVLRSPGCSLDAETQSFMAPRFGHDFSNVRVHTDAMAADSARAVNALAYTVGRHIVFDAGFYSPRTRTGRELIAHELTHTIQQDGREDSAVGEISNSQDSNEIEASRLAAQIVSQPASGDLSSNELPGASAKYVSSLSRNMVQRHVLESDPATAPSMACAVASDTVSDYVLTIPFNEGSATLAGVDKMVLADLATEWHLSPIQSMVRIDGFASIDGGPAQNWPLSCNRAAAVANELTAPSVGGKPGIPASSLEFFANGETDRFSTGLAPNRVARINAPGVARPTSREPSIFNWSHQISGSTDPTNCCAICPVNLGVDCAPPDLKNGIEFNISVRDHSPSYSYDIKRTKEAKYHRTMELPMGMTGPWETISALNKPAGTSDDARDSDECQIPQANGSVHTIFSEDRPGFKTATLRDTYNSYLQMINFIEFVRIRRPDGATYDDAFQQNWHTKMLVEKSGGAWSVNTSESEIDTGHLASLDP